LLETIPQGLKPLLLVRLMYGLKPVPFKLRHYEFWGFLVLALGRVIYLTG
jgi:hypothetical protein